ncbi:MAG: hypothetical protein UV68_C0049G0001, partial [Candidatus Collierbacteria bacterium GW2011_GWC2_43_12]
IFGIKFQSTIASDPHLGDILVIDERLF